MQVRKQQLELDMEQWAGSKLGNESVRAVQCHPAYLTSMQGTSCEMLDWMKHKLESRLPGETSITSDMQNDTTLMVESEEELKSLLMKVKEESEKKNWLETQHSKNEDHSIQSHHFMENTWGKSGDRDKFYFLGLQNHCGQ